MPPTVISSGTLPKSSSTVADMFLANAPYLDYNVSKVSSPTKFTDVIVIAGAIFLTIFLVKKVI